MIWIGGDVCQRFYFKGARVALAFSEPARSVRRSPMTTGNTDSVGGWIVVLVVAATAALLLVFAYINM